MKRPASQVQPVQPYNEMEENQFSVSPSRATFNNGGVSKDQTIKKLEERNKRLYNEIKKIEKILDEPEDKPAYGIQLPQISSKATEQELQNAYKQIKSYEYEVKKLKDGQEGGSYTEKIRKLQSILRQKQDASEKLKRKIATSKKKQLQNTKFLENDNIKQQYQSKTVKLSTQVKWLRQKLKQLVSKRQTTNSNMQKQMRYITKLQSQLVKMGFPSDNIKVLKDKFAPKADQYDGPSNANESYYNNVNSTQKTQINKVAQVQVIQDRTPQEFSSIKNQIKLLQKMDKDYQNQILNLQKQKTTAVTINQKSRSKLLQIQNQIETIESKLLDLKKIDPMKIRTSRGLSMPNVINKNGARYNSALNNSNTHNMSNNDSLNTSNFQGKNNKKILSKKSSQSLPSHLFKTLEIGKITKKGKQFNDRPYLGKNEAKIVAIQFYQQIKGEGENQVANLIGFQATYEINKTIRKGESYMFTAIDPQKISKKNFNLFEQQDFFKAIECTVNDSKNIIGIGLLSSKKKPSRAGNVNGTKKVFDLKDNQYPACLYGSYTDYGLEMLGIQILQQKIK